MTDAKVGVYVTCLYPKGCYEEGGVPELRVGAHYRVIRVTDDGDYVLAGLKYSYAQERFVLKDSPDVKVNFGLADVDAKRIRPQDALRDEFAGRAMAAFCSPDFMHDLAKIAVDRAEVREEIARLAYAQADAMLAERAKRMEKGE